MAIQSAEAQTSTLAKLAPPHTAAHKLSHQPLNLRSRTSLGRWQLCFCGHPDTSTQTPACRTGVLVRRLRSNLSQLRFLARQKSALGELISQIQPYPDDRCRRSHRLLLHRTAWKSSD